MSAIRVVFRVDASLQIGSGHVMRCLTLADALKARDVECQFICREHPGNLIEHIKNKDYKVATLPFSAAVVERNLLAPDKGQSEPGRAVYAEWLGAPQRQDAAECAVILGEFRPDWLIVDHYALDASWEKLLQPHYRQLMVIDDLANRPHHCSLLLDQTFGRSAGDYEPWVSAGCTVLCGSQYALLRPEFVALRPYSLTRRESPQLERLLISMGGVDKDNATGLVLQVLKHCALPPHCRLTVVMGASAPWLTEVRQQAELLPWATEVRINVSDMAQLMAESDLAIGAAGSTSWERCCLGLPTVMVVLADNQKQVAQGLEQVGAVYALQGSQQIKDRLPCVLSSLVSSSAQRVAMSQAARRIADGNGVASVIQQLER